MRRTYQRRLMHSFRARGPWPVVATIAVLLAGCAFSGETREPLPEGGQARTFEAVQRVLIDHGFVLDRIDARAGVITTRPKASPGLFLPTDREQRSLGQEFRDALHTHSRTVRVTMPTDAPRNTGATVEVVLERASRPGFRIETEEIGMSSAFSSPSFDDLSQPVPIRRDAEFEGYLQREIAALIGSAPTADAPSD